MKTLQAYIDEIEERKNRGHGLSHFLSYMKTLKNPHCQIDCIHVAGTNGKGSTVNYLRSILQEAGYKVGTFTSPYLIHHQDRIRINDEDISDEVFLQIIQQHYDDWVTWDLSMFEIDMVIACLWFLQEKVDIAIFETGLGGRLDATNIVTPIVSVITNIGMDHMQLLGDTYQKIAYEKAGIIKKGIDVITAETKEDCLAVFHEVAKSHDTHCLTLSTIRNIEKGNYQVHFDYRDFSSICISQGALYQCDNAVLAIETCLYIHKHTHFTISKQAIYDGISSTIWKGRFELLSTEPLMILDGAHNPEGIQALVDSLAGIENLHILFSVLEDKKFDEMLTILQTVSTHIYVYNTNNARALDMRIWKDKEAITYVESFESVIQQAFLQKKPLVITGSLYFVSEVRAYWQRK